VVWPFGSFSAFFDEFGLEDFSLALMLFFGFILAFSTLWYRSVYRRSDRITAYAHLTLGIRSV